MLADVGALLLASPGIAVPFVIRWKHPRTVAPIVAGTPNRWLASRFEERVFFELCQRFPAGCFVISAHMLLADVIGRNRLSELSIEERRFAWLAHCDFVVVDRKNLVTVRVIEVNGSFHGDPAQKRRDAQKKKLLERFGILLEIKR